MISNATSEHRDVEESHNDVRTPRAAKKRFRIPRWPAPVWASVIFIFVTFVVGALAPFTAPYSPTATDVANKFAGPSLHHLLGTDPYGRDVLSRLIWGALPSYEGVAIALLVGLAVGVPWGIVAGMSKGQLGNVLMRLADVFLSFPGIILALAVTSVLGPDLVHSMVAVGIVFSPAVARLTRVGVQGVRDREFVLSARLSGCPRRVIWLRHVLPASAPPVVVQATIFLGLAFIVQAALSYLGLGIQPPHPSWGGDLSTAYEFIFERYEGVIAPGVLIALVVLSFYQIGDYLRRALSVRSISMISEDELRESA